MKPRKKHITVYIRNGIAFLLTYIAMMGIFTYITAGRTESRMAYASSELVAELNNMMNKTSPERENVYYSSNAAINQYMNRIMRNAADMRIYLRAKLYNHSDELVAQTGNIISLWRPDEDNNDYLRLEDYMSVSEINSFFKPDELGTKYIRITGTNSSHGIIPQKIELRHGEIKEKIFSSISDDAEEFGDWSELEYFYEHLYYNRKITETSVKRYDKCTEIAEPLLNQYRTYGSAPPGFIKEGLFSSQYAGVLKYEGSNPLNDRYISFGIVYYPLAFTAKQLMPVYILSLVFISILMLYLSAKLNVLFTEQTELEQSRQTFTNTITYGLKSPLAIIRSFSEDLNEETDDEKRKHCLDVIINEIGQMDTMVHEMLKLPKPESCPEKRYPVVTPVHILINQVLLRYDKMIADQHLNVSVSCHEEDLIKGDKTMLVQVISDLLCNAIRHTPEGGNIKISTIEKYKLRKKILHFSVENSSNGIPRDQLNTIWDANNKTDLAHMLSDKSDLDLFIVKNILRLHGFDFGVQNTENSVKFWFEEK